MKHAFTYIIGLFLFFPLVSFAQNSTPQKEEALFRAQVIEIVEQKTITRDDGSSAVQQKLQLKGLEAAWKDKEILVDGMRMDVVAMSTYAVGDKVVVSYSPGPEGEDIFEISGFSRTTPIYWLVFLFALIVIAIGRWKGFRALTVLVFTFVIILQFIIPQILAGNDPLFISIIGSLFILILAVYVTEGVHRTSTLAICAIVLSLIITGLLSAWFTGITQLTGFASEEAMYLVGLSGSTINIKGLLLAGIIIGALGVLDDAVIAQISLVEELKAANPELTKHQLYSKAMRVGISHVSSMVNTLFLAYAGASLPLLILFSIDQPPFLTFTQAIDNEMIATEIVRSFTGSIGLTLAIPITTLLAVHFLKDDKNTHNGHSHVHRHRSST